MTETTESAVPTEATAALTHALYALAHAQFALVQHVGVDDLPSVADRLDGTGTAGAEATTPIAHLADVPLPAPSDDRTSGGRDTVDADAGAHTRSGAALPDPVPAVAGLSFSLDLEPEPVPVPAVTGDDLDDARSAYLGTLPPESVAPPAANSTMHLLEEIAFLED